MKQTLFSTLAKQGCSSTKDLRGKYAKMCSSLLWGNETTKSINKTWCPVDLFSVSFLF